MWKRELLYSFKWKNAVLIDTCREKYREMILNACKDYHVQLLILTHGHIDHVQNAAYLSDRLHIFLNGRMYRAWQRSCPIIL